MMKLSLIKIQGMHKVKSKTYDLSGFRYFHGENGAGKSTVMQAIQLALLGYIPGTDKNKSAIFKHSNAPEMMIQLTIDDNGHSIVITRSWQKKGKEISAYCDVKPSTYDIKGIVGNLELPVFNFSEFIGMTANKMKDWFINFLPAADNSLSWKKLLNDSISDFGKILDTQFVDETISYIDDKSQYSQGVKLVRDFNTYLKEQQSFKKGELIRVQSTVQSLIYYDDCDDSLDADVLRDENHQNQLIKDSLSKKILLISQNEKVQRSPDEAMESATADTLEVDPIYVQNSQVIASAETEIEELSSNINKWTAERVEYTQQIKEKQLVLDGRGQCPYSHTVCEAIVQLLNTFKSDIGMLTEKVSELNSDIAEATSRLAKSQSIKSIKEKCNQNLRTAYIQRDNLRSQLHSEVSDMAKQSLLEELDALNKKMTKTNDLIIKVEANKRYNELTDKLTAEKFRIEQDIEILKVWIKLTDVNGLQSQLMEEPFKKLADNMSVYLQKFFSGTGKFSAAKFYLSEKANSFGFGVLNQQNEYIEFDLLSSGEKCLYTLALLLSIVDASDSPLKLVMIDDLLDHLDTARIKDCFSTLYSISTIHVLLAGVQDCRHSNADEFVVEVASD